MFCYKIAKISREVKITLSSKESLNKQKLNKIRQSKKTKKIVTKVNCMKKLKVLSMLVVLAFGVVFTGCEKNEDMISQQNIMADESILLSEVDSVIDMTSQLKHSTSQWGSYPILNSTSNSADYFSAGLYAVKIKRSWYDSSIITFSLTAQKQDNDDVAYTWAYKYDENGNQIYYSGVKTFSTTNIHPISNISISGNESIVYILKVNNPGYYVYWYSH